MLRHLSVGLPTRERVHVHRPRHVGAHVYVRVCLRLVSFSFACFIVFAGTEFLSTLVPEAG